MYFKHRNYVIKPKENRKIRKLWKQIYKKCALLEKSCSNYFNHKDDEVKFAKKICNMLDSEDEETEVGRKIYEDITRLQIEIDKEVIAKHLYTDLSDVKDIILSIDDFNHKSRSTGKLLRSTIKYVFDDNSCQSMRDEYDFYTEKLGTDLFLFVDNGISLMGINLDTGKYSQYVGKDLIRNGNVIGLAEFRIG